MQGPVVQHMTDPVVQHILGPEALAIQVLGGHDIRGLAAPLLVGLAAHFTRGPVVPRMMALVAAPIQVRAAHATPVQAVRVIRVPAAQGAAVLLCADDKATGDD
jgi:hypothetical protein